MDRHGAEPMPVHGRLEQLKVMSAIESCRTAALGGHVARCEECAYTTIAEVLPHLERSPLPRPGDQM